MRPGEILGQEGRPPPNSTPPHQASKRLPRSFAPSPVFTAFTWAKGLLGSERQGKVCRGFKVIPRTSCLRRHGAAHGSHAAAPDSGARGLPGGRCTGCKCPPVPTLSESHPHSGMGLGNSVYKKPLVHHQAPRSGPEGKGPAVLQEVPRHSLLRRPGVSSSPETKSATPLDLTSMLGWEEVGCYCRG